MIDPALPSAGELSDITDILSLDVLKGVSHDVAARNGELRTNESVFIKYSKRPVQYDYEFPQVRIFSSAGGAL